MLTTTSSVLLKGLEDPEDEATWREFDARYRPLLYGFARRLALADEDALEVAQDALVAFVQDYRAGKYDVQRGRLRAWLFGMIRARVARVKRDRARDRIVGRESALVDLPDDHTMSAMWEDQWRRAILLESLRRLRAETRTDPRTLRVFQALTLEERSVSEVADQEGMTANAVYQARFRALEQLRAILTRLEEEW